MSREDRIRKHDEQRRVGAAERIAKHDRQFADEYLPGPEGRPISAALAMQLGMTAEELSLARVARGASHTHAREEDDQRRAG